MTAARGAGSAAAAASMRAVRSDPTVVNNDSSSDYRSLATMLPRRMDVEREQWKAAGRRWGFAMFVRLMQRTRFSYVKPTSLGSRRPWTRPRLTGSVGKFHDSSDCVCTQSGRSCVGRSVLCPASLLAPRPSSPTDRFLNWSQYIWSASDKCWIVATPGAVQ